MQTAALERRQLAGVLLLGDRHRLGGCGERLGGGNAWFARLQTVVHAKRACRGVFGERLEHGARGNRMELGQWDHFARRSARSIRPEAVPALIARMATAMSLPLVICKRTSRSARLADRLLAAAGKLRQTAAGRQWSQGHEHEPNRFRTQRAGQRTVSRDSFEYRRNNQQT